MTIVRGWQRLLWALLLTSAANSAGAALRVDLNGAWRFRTDVAGRGAAEGWSRQMPAGTRLVDVPHTWNADSEGADADFEGVGWYFKDLDAAALQPAKHVELHFGATFYSARVWLNGVEIGSHEGGHTAYWFDISGRLRRDGGVNKIAVRIDNRPTRHSLPGYAMRQAASGSVWYDWWHEGGIVRDVWLEVSTEALIRKMKLTSTLTDHLAQVSARVQVENLGAGRQTYHVRATAFAPDGSTAATADAPLQLAAAGGGDIALPLTVRDPVLWNVGDGQLYQVVAELQDSAGHTVATQTDTLGLRRIEIRDRRLLVNGHPVRLTGLTRHEDSPWEGLAETRGTVLHDWNDLRDLHTTLTRPVHYPQSKAVLDYADRHGILLVPEIPMWQFDETQMRDRRVLALAQQMMGEMIDQNGNHPSIFAWSICNESDARTAGGLAYVTAMKSFIRERDPTRFVTYADADLGIAPWPDEPAAHLVDFVMANAYFGTWDGPAEQVEPWLDFMDRTYPEKMVIVSEFGYPGPFAADTASADRARIANLRQQLDAFERRPFIAGAIFWTYQDYKSHRNLWSGETAGYVDHGVVDEHRQRRPSYAAWQDRNAPLRATAQWTSTDSGLTGFRAVLVPNLATQLPSYPLAGHRVVWRMVDRDGHLLGEGTQTLATLDAPTAVDGHWPSVKQPSGGRLTLRVLAPDGAEALRTVLDDAGLHFGSAAYPPRPETETGR